MAKVRAVVVGFQDSNGNIVKAQDTIPADWVSGDRDALDEIYNNKKLRTKLSVRSGSAIWAQISDPYEEALPHSQLDDPWTL